LDQAIIGISLVLFS